MDAIVTTAQRWGLYPPILARLFVENTTRKTKEKLAFLTLVVLPFGLGFEILYFFALLGLTIALYRPLDLQLALLVSPSDKKILLELLRESGRAEEALLIGGADVHEKILSLRALAKVRKQHAQHSEALKLLEEAYALLPSSAFMPVSSNTKTFERTMELAETINDLATTLSEQPNKDNLRILSLYEESVKLGRSTVGRDDPRVTMWLMNLGIFKQQELAQFKDSMSLYDEVLEVRKQVLGADDPLVAQWMVNMAYLLLARPDAVEIGARIEELVHGALQIRKRIYGVDHVDVAASLNDCALMAALTAKDGDDAGLVRARKFGMQSRETYERVLGKNHPTTQKARADWG